MFTNRSQISRATKLALVARLDEFDALDSEIDSGISEGFRNEAMYVESELDQRNITDARIAQMTGN